MRNFYDIRLRISSEDYPDLCLMLENEPNQMRRTRKILNMATIGLTGNKTLLGANVMTTISSEILKQENTGSQNADAESDRNLTDISPDIDLKIIGGFVG